MATVTAASAERTGKRAWVGAVLSAVLPGAGQIYAGRYRRGGVWMIPAFVALGAILLLSRASVADLVGQALSLTSLRALLVIDILAFGWRLAAALDAWFIISHDPGSEPLASAVAVAAVIGLVAIIPHAWLARTTTDAIRLVDAVFVTSDADGVDPIIPIGTDADIVPDPALSGPVVHDYEPAPPTTASHRNLIFREGFGDPDAVDVWDDVVLSHNDGGGSPAPFVPFTERVDSDRITVLLAGGDGGPGRGGMRTDTMMVATIDVTTGKAALFGFPRNLGQTPLPGGFATAFIDLEKKLIARTTPSTTIAAGVSSTTLAEGQEAPQAQPFVSCHCFPEQLNALYPFTRRWTRTYPNEVDPGMAALRDTLEHVMGLRIDYYALVDMAAFVDLVDAIGGVDVNVLQPIQAEVSPPREGDPWATVDVDVGWHHLTGPEALAYARARKGSSDYARMERQRCMVRAVAAKADPLTLLRHFSAIVDAVEGSVVTDVPLSFAPDLLTAAARLDFDDIETVGFVPNYYAHERDYLYHPIPDVDRIRAKVRSVLRGQLSQDSGESEPSECDA